MSAGSQVTDTGDKGWRQIAGLPIAAWATLLLQVALIIIWAVQLDARVQQQERDIGRIAVSIETLFNRLQNFIERVDRLDTPLSRHVAQLQILVSALNDRASANSTQLNLHRADISRLEKQLDAIKKDIEELKRLSVAPRL